MSFPNIAVMCLVSVKKENLSLKIRRVVGSRGEVIVYLRYSAMLPQLKGQLNWKINLQGLCLAKL